jgi:hypothetical protein
LTVVGMQLCVGRLGNWWFHGISVPISPGSVPSTRIYSLLYGVLVNPSSGGNAGFI